MTKEQNKFNGWKDELQSIINANLSIRDNGKIASNKTQSDRATFLFSFFHMLREKGYAVSPHNLKQKHIQVACDYYVNEKKVSPATIQTYLMHLRALARWIGKDGMVKTASEYISDKSKYERTYAATEDKSWEGAGIDVQAKINEISLNHPWIAAQLLVEHAFGLRRKEAISLRPYMNIIEDNLHVVDGSKGGKARIIPIETDYQRDVAELAKSMVGKTSKTLSDPQFDLKQNLKKHSNVLSRYGITKKDLGVTGHGHRHGYAHTLMEQRGLVPLIKGGEIGQLPKEQEKEIRLEVSQKLGHNRVGITTAYSGPLSEVGKRKIEKAKKTENN